MKRGHQFSKVNTRAKLKLGQELPGPVTVKHYADCPQCKAHRQVEPAARGALRCLTCAHRFFREKDFL